MQMPLGWKENEAVDPGILSGMRIGWLGDLGGHLAARVDAPVWLVDDHGHQQAWVLRRRKANEGGDELVDALLELLEIRLGDRRERLTLSLSRDAHPRLFGRRGLAFLQDPLHAEPQRRQHQATHREWDRVERHRTLREQAQPVLDLLLALGMRRQLSREGFALPDPTWDVTGAKLVLGWLDDTALNGGVVARCIEQEINVIAHRPLGGAGKVRTEANGMTAPSAIRLA